MKINAKSSIKKEVIPFLQKELKDKGFVLLSYEATSEEDLEKDLLAFILLCGSYFSSWAAYFTLKGENAPEPLEVHNECIYSKSGVISYFALGCLQPSLNGGETRIFDARKAAKMIEKEYPELAKVRIYYTSNAYPNEGAEYPLVFEDPEYGKVLRYRAKTKSNFIKEIPKGYSENDIYQIVDEILSKCLVLAHKWNKGDILFVNNRITLHDRMPYVGSRIMLRVRFDDPNNKKFTY
jgi:hypothetical protein